MKRQWQTVVDVWALTTTTTTKLKEKLDYNKKWFINKQNAIVYVFFSNRISNIACEFLHIWWSLKDFFFLFLEETN
jgi:hypothetical protein